jgi:hypothetical protein
VPKSIINTAEPTPPSAAPKRTSFQNDKAEHDHRQVKTEPENQRKTQNQVQNRRARNSGADRRKQSHITNSNEGNSGETMTTQNPRPPHITPETNPRTKGVNVKTRKNDNAGEKHHQSHGETKPQNLQK